LGGCLFQCHLDHCLQQKLVSLWTLPSSLSSASDVLLSRASMMSVALNFFLNILVGKNLTLCQAWPTTVTGVPTDTTVFVCTCHNHIEEKPRFSSMASQYIVTYSGFYIHDGTLLHSKSQYTTVKHSRQVFEHTYTSDPHGLGTLTHIEFFQQDVL
jgi:hypothetical protein